MREGWEIKKLGEVFRTSSGGTPSKSHREYYEGGYIKWLRSGEVSQGEIWDTEMHITEDGVKNSSAKMFPVDTVVIAMYGATVGQVGILKAEMTTNQAICGIFPTPSVQPSFLSYFLKSHKSKFLELASGAAQPNISQQIIKDTFVPVPPIAEQERIVSELDCLTGIIETKKQQLEELDKLAKSIFYDMFGDPITNEKGWEVKKLKDVAVIVGGSTPKTNVEEFWNGQNPWVAPAELHQNHYISSTERGISNEAAKGLTLLPVGTVLLSSRAPIGKVSITTIPMYCNQGFKNVVCSKALNNEYVYHLLLNKTEYLNSLGTGATFKEISKKTTENIAIAVPPIELQEAFAAQSRAIEKQKELVKQSIVETETLFNSRMDYWFN